MPFIRSFSIDCSNRHVFPFNVPAVKHARNVLLPGTVTIFVGDNGSGKSTLLESLASKLKLSGIGGGLDMEDGDYAAAGEIIPRLNISWSREIQYQGFFFRAEDFSHFLRGLDRERVKINHQLFELKGEVDDSIIKQMEESSNWKLRAMRKEYGDNMQAYSHGEGFLKILEQRMKGKGIFVLDEPEAALSPLRQLSLISMIMQMAAKGNAQFIMATHSPILMGIPNATIYQVTEDGMEQVAYRETTHYSITKNFLDNPEGFLRYLEDV
jgi:predicted ATPase